MLYLWKIFRKKTFFKSSLPLYRGVAHSICNSKFNVPNEIPVVSITAQMRLPFYDKKIGKGI